jgi:signal transduction histidine kinase
VVAEVGGLFGADICSMAQYRSDETTVGLATWAANGEPHELPGPQPLEGTHLAGVIHRTGRPAREDDWDDAPGPVAAYVRDVLHARSAVASPIIVSGRVWGALFVFLTGAEPLPADTESRLGKFTELVATAISDAQSRSEAQRLVDEQAALRRVATLVAREPGPEEVFAAVAEEAAHVLELDDTRIVRFEGDGTATMVASWGVLAGALPVGTQISLEGETANTRVSRTARAARIDDFSTASGPFAASLRALGVRSSVAVPILVEGKLWGAMSTACLRHEPLPPDTEARMVEFTELAATAIANVKARSELAASRTRLVEAADEERRRLVRDLHDGAQQRLVYTVVTLKLAARALARGDERASELVAQALANAQQATHELRELAHGILPRVLTRGGLRAAAHALAYRMPVPIEVDVTGDRLPPAIEATAYFFVAEALTNVAKHAQATHARVVAEVEDSTFHVQVRDDGVGGARSDGRGLLGLADRVAVLDGKLTVESPAEGGSVVSLAVPIPKWADGRAQGQDAEPRR